MGNLEERIKETKIRKVMAEWLGIKGTVSPDHTAQSEQVIAIVRKEDMSSIPPNDTQCNADVEGSRCEKEIAFNMTNYTWSQMCEAHDLQNENARANTPDVSKVLKFVESKA